MSSLFRKYQFVIYGLIIAFFLTGILVLGLHFNKDKGLLAGVKDIIIDSSDDESEVTEQAVYMKDGEDDAIKNRILVASFVKDEWQAILSKAEVEGEWEDCNYKFKEPNTVYLQGKRNEELSNIVMVQVEISEDRKNIDYKIIEELKN